MAARHENPQQTTMSTMRQEQAFNDGRMAFRERKRLEDNHRRNPQQRQAWIAGFEHERRIDLGTKVTPEERATTERVASKLKDWAQQFRKEHP
jgi:hypothetical protein